MNRLKSPAEEKTIIILQMTERSEICKHGWRYWLRGILFIILSLTIGWHILWDAVGRPILGGNEYEYIILVSQHTLILFVVGLFIGYFNKDIWWIAAFMAFGHIQSGLMGVGFRISEFIGNYILPILTNGRLTTSTKFRLDYFLIFLMQLIVPLVASLAGAKFGSTYMRKTIQEKEFGFLKQKKPEDP